MKFNGGGLSFDKQTSGRSMLRHVYQISNAFHALEKKTTTMNLLHWNPRKIVVHIFAESSQTLFYSLQPGNLKRISLGCLPLDGSVSSDGSLFATVQYQYHELQVPQVKWAASPQSTLASCAIFKRMDAYGKESIQKILHNDPKGHQSTKKKLDQGFGNLIVF